MAVTVGITKCISNRSKSPCFWYCRPTLRKLRAKDMFETWVSDGLFEINFDTQYP